MKNIALFFCLFLLANECIDAQCTEADPALWDNTWESCQSSPNPNTDRGESHWIQYDFAAIYTLSKTRIWNANATEKLNSGFKEVIVDYSEDGMAWTNLGTFEFSQGTGDVIYAGFAGPDFEGKQARYVLLTAISNWGHESCFGLAEIKFNLTNQATTIEPPCDEPPCNGNEECMAPEEVEIETEEPTEAFLFWEETDVEFYIVRFRTIDGEWEEMETDEPELFLEDLEPDTEYEFQIQAVCEEESSDFSESYFFSTLTEMEECLLPENTVVDVLNPNAVVVSWEDLVAAEVYRFRYRKKSSFQSWVKTTNEDSFRALENLEANTVYLYQIRVLCPNGWTGWSRKYRFKTSPASINVPQTDFNSDVYQDDLLVFPNPAKDVVNVVYRNVAASEVRLVLNNVAGQKVYQSSSDLNVGSHQFSIPLSDLEAGFYFVSLYHQNNGTISTQRLVVMSEQ